MRTPLLDATALSRTGIFTPFGPATAHELITAVPTPLLLHWGSGLLSDLAEQGEPAARLRRLAYKFHQLQSGQSSRRKPSQQKNKARIVDSLLSLWKKGKEDPFQKNGSNAVFENLKDWRRYEHLYSLKPVTEAHAYTIVEEFQRALMDRNIPTSWEFFAPFFDQISLTDYTSHPSFFQFILQIPVEERDSLLDQYLSREFPSHIGVYRRVRQTFQRQTENRLSELDFLQKLKGRAQEFAPDRLIVIDTNSSFDLALGQFYFEKFYHPYRRFLGFYSLFQELKKQEVRSYSIDPESVPLWTPAWEIRLRETSLKETDFDTLIRSFDDFRHGRTSKNHSFGADEKLRKEYEKIHRLFLALRRDRIDRDEPVFPTIGALARYSGLTETGIIRELKWWETLTKRIPILTFIPEKGLVVARRFVTPYRVLQYLQTERKRLGISEDLIFEMHQELAKFKNIRFLSYFYYYLRKTKTVEQVRACFLLYQTMAQSFHDSDEESHYYQQVFEILLQTPNPLDEAEKYQYFVNKLNGTTFREPILKPTYADYSIGEKMTIWNEFLCADKTLTYDEADLALKYLFTKRPEDRKTLSEYIIWFYKKKREDPDCIPKLQANLKRKVLQNHPEIRERLRALPDHHAGAEAAFVKNIYPGISADALEAAVELFELGLNLHGEWFRQYRSLPPEKRRNLLSSANIRSIKLLEGETLQEPLNLSEMIALLLTVGNPRLETQTALNILAYAKIKKPKHTQTFPINSGKTISYGILSAKDVQPDREKIKRYLRPVLRFRNFDEIVNYLGYLHVKTDQILPDPQTSPNVTGINILKTINRVLTEEYRLPKQKRKIHRSDIYNLLLIRALYGYTTPETRKSIFQFETANSPKDLQESIMAATRFFEDFVDEANRTFPIPFVPNELAWNLERRNSDLGPREPVVIFEHSRIKKLAQKTEVVKLVRGILEWNHFGEYTKTARYLLKKAGLNLTDTVTEENVVIFVQILLQVFSNYQGGLKTNFDFFVMELLMAYALHSPKATEARKMTKNFLLSVKKSALNEQFHQLGQFYAKLFEMAKGMEISFVPKFLEKTTQQLLQERQKLGKITYRSGKLRFVPLQGKMAAFFGYMGEDCLAKEDYAMNSLSDPDFLPVGMILHGRLVGVFQLYTRTIRGQKYLIVSGIDPKENIVFDPEVFVPILEKMLLNFAQKNGYQRILLTDISGTLSSRRGKLEEELKRRYPTTLTISAPKQREFCFPIQRRHRHKGARGYAEHRQFRQVWIGGRS